MNKILEVKELEYFYQDGDTRRYIFKGVNYTFEKGKFYAILGESGSGKTTLLSILGGMESQTDGTVVFNEQELGKDLDLNAYRRNDIGMVFQSYNLIPTMTARENLLCAMSITDNVIEKEDEVTYNLLDYIGIVRTKADRIVTKLSGGEQQRVAIARALSTNVDLILADEPTGNLDGDTERAIIEIFKKLTADHGKCVIVVTHSKAVAAQADVVINLTGGR